jgi:competence protein CoiA
VHFYALKDQSPVFVTSAVKGQDYRCPECLGSVRIRGGWHRQIHFYHLKKPLLCQQHRKSLAHLQAQRFIHSLLPEGEGALEKSFPSIGRIADVAWIKRKIIFEIQCSPISLEEAKNRSEDYRKMGFTPVWILHDRRFNRNRLSAAEHFLRKRECYFTNIDERGMGMIYDQEERYRENRRLFRGPPLRIHVGLPITVHSLQRLHFSGDFREHSGGKVRKEWRALLSKEPPFSITAFAVHLYRTSFRWLIETLTQ